MEPLQYASSESFAWQNQPALGGNPRTRENPVNGSIRLPWVAAFRCHQHFLRVKKRLVQNGFWYPLFGPRFSRDTTFSAARREASSARHNVNRVSPAY